MDVENYKTRLKNEEKSLMNRMAHAEAAGKDPGEDPNGDAADRSTTEQRREEQFRRADSEWSRLRQVREALTRIENGVYGQCVVDGAPIGKERLDAMPWTPVCRKHQEEHEDDHPARTPTL